MKIEKHQMSTNRGKRMKETHDGHKNNYMDNLSGKQCEASEDWWEWLGKRCLKITNEALIMAT